MVNLSLKTKMTMADFISEYNIVSFFLKPLVEMCKRQIEMRNNKSNPISPFPLIINSHITWPRVDEIDFGKQIKLERNII